MEETTETKPLGRPTIYGQEMLNKTKEYVETCEDDEVQQTIGMSAKGTELFKNKVIVNLPSIEGLAYHLGIHKDTIYEWCKSFSDFSDVIDKLRAKQAKALINKGLSGDYNPTIAKVLLTKHGYIDKQDVTSDGKAIKGNSIIFSNFKEE